jgi:hypothetical protein
MSKKATCHLIVIGAVGMGAPNRSAEVGGAANDAGYGNYVKGRDPECDWYEDRDSDSIVCNHG